MRCGHVWNLKLRKFFLACFHSFIRKFAPTKISRYTVLHFWRCMARTLTTSSCWDLPIDSYDIVTTCLIMSEMGLSSQQSTWKYSGPHSQNMAWSTQATYRAHFIDSLYFHTFNSMLVERLVHRANSLLRMINASWAPFTL